MELTDKTEQLYVSFNIKHSGHYSGVFSILHQLLLRTNLQITGHIQLTHNDELLNLESHTVY